VAESGEHPFARWPVIPRPDAERDPRHVGPEWSAPTAPLTPEEIATLRRGLRAPLSGLRMFALLAALGALPALATIAVFWSLAPDVEDVGGDIDDFDRLEHGGKPRYVFLPPPPTGRCIAPDNAERERTLYTAERDWGSARRLRRRVALVSLRLGGGAAAWTPAITWRLDIGTVAAQKFFLREAARYGIDDLDVTVVPVSLVHVDFPVPELLVDSRHRLQRRTGEMLDRRIRQVVRRALGETLERAATRLRNEDGYDSVAFMANLPVGGYAREQAHLAQRDWDLRSSAELAFVFVRRHGELGLAYIVAHEALHLFGADDLYSLRVADPADSGDIMSDWCTDISLPDVGRIGDATAWAIGWRPRPPQRAYRFAPAAAH